MAKFFYKTFFFILFLFLIFFLYINFVFASYIIIDRAKIRNYEEVYIINNENFLEGEANLEIVSNNSNFFIDFLPSVNYYVFKHNDLLYFNVVGCLYPIYFGENCSEDKILFPTIDNNRIIFYTNSSVIWVKINYAIKRQILQKSGDYYYGFFRTICLPENFCPNITRKDFPYRIYLLLPQDVILDRMHNLNVIGIRRNGQWVLEFTDLKGTVKYRKNKDLFVKSFCWSLFGAFLGAFLGIIFMLLIQCVQPIKKLVKKFCY